MKIIFSHGQESGPWGTKIQRLAKISAERGIEVESVDYTDTMDPDVRVERLVELLTSEGPDVLLAGSSMGGYVSLVASNKAPVRALFLMAPALYISGYKCQTYPSKASFVDIVHGWNDDVIPAENSIRFAGEYNHSLHLIPGNHALSDSLQEVDRLFSDYLDRALMG